MVITLDLNLVNNNTDNKIQEAYNKEVDPSNYYHISAFMQRLSSSG